MATKVITPEMETFFTKNALKMSKKSMAKHFGVSESVVDTHFKKNNIVVPKEVWIGLRAKAMTGKTTFTKKEDRFIKKNYLTMPVKTIASALNRSGVGVIGRLKAMDLVIPQELADERKAIGMYRKGQIPVNKGKKQNEFMSPEAIERTKATRFKPGLIPANSLKDGEETQRMDKRSNRIYTLIKLPGNRKLVYKHIHLWEQENKKKLPKGFNIVFKDGDSQNIEIDNLECISNSELMSRNTMHRYPKDVTDLIHLKAAISRQINKHKKIENDK